MIKRYVLDTNVLIHDPKSILKFEDNEVILPITVIEELDDLKKRPNSVGFNARSALRELDKLRGLGALHEGVNLDNGGLLRIELGYDAHRSLPDTMDSKKPDNMILAVGCHMRSSQPETPIIMVTKDSNVRIKADALGLAAMDYESEKVDVTELFRGFDVLYVEKKLIDQFISESRLEIPGRQFYPNQCVLLKVENTGRSALGKYSDSAGALVPLLHMNAKPWGIDARNLEQRLAIELLLCDDVQLVSLVGSAGTGKTLLALAAGLQKVLDEKTYRRLLVARPIVPMGKDIGYLPGGKDEKLGSWMQPITDNLDFLFGADVKNNYSYLFEKKIIQVEALTYIRGRSLPDSYIIIDESQNLSPHEIKTIITRAGERSKIILTGDAFQIDNQYLDESSNGLSFVAEKFRQEPLAGHIVLRKGERSELASRAADLL